MKSTKETGKQKSKKNSRKQETYQSIDANTVKPVPSEDDIRQKAKEIYHGRLTRGENGSALTDWLNAESFFYGADEL